MGLQPPRATGPGLGLRRAAYVWDLRQSGWWTLADPHHRVLQREPFTENRDTESGVNVIAYDLFDPTHVVEVARIPVPAVDLISPGRLTLRDCFATSM